jgi:7-carboxy-7-deazaguanine synthase
MNVFVTEVFYSFQGEGVNAGQPRVFVRLATNCPLSCCFCDSKYAREESRLLTSDDISLMRNHPLIVFTGNEPLFSNGPRYIDYIINEVNPLFIEIETNGTCIPSIIDRLINKITLWTISPKNPKFQTKEVDTTPHLLGYLTSRGYANYAVKFVYNDADDDNFILSIVKGFDVPNFKVWIMPRGENRDVYLKHLPLAWEFALKHRFNLSPRLHIETFDTRRGV